MTKVILTVSLCILLACAALLLFQEISTRRLCEERGGQFTLTPLNQGINRVCR